MSRSGLHAGEASLARLIACQDLRFRVQEFRAWGLGKSRAPVFVGGVFGFGDSPGSCVRWLGYRVRFGLSVDCVAATFAGLGVGRLRYNMR